MGLTVFTRGLWFAVLIICIYPTEDDMDLLKEIDVRLSQAKQCRTVEDMRHAVNNAQEILQMAQNAKCVLLVERQHFLFKENDNSQ